MMDGVRMMGGTKEELADFKGLLPLRRTPKVISRKGFHDEHSFGVQLRIERKRAERSKRCFCLMLIDVRRLSKQSRWRYLGRIANVLFTETRETDIKGWYQHGSRIGVIFTELGSAEQDLVPIVERMIEKVYTGLSNEMEEEEMQRIDIDWHIFPENLDIGKNARFQNKMLYADMSQVNKGRGFGLFMKRSVDIIGSFTGLLLLSPVFLGIALLVKLTSPGPVFFRQERVGLFGEKFTFLKFRSMHVNNDPSIHREFVNAFINKSKNSHNNGNGNGDEVFKITNDPRVTSIGRFMRKTSLDELPQLINVLVGDMSLVGPRPPIPYEYESYDVWHRRRLSLMRPGITGLWQVCGRSRVTFDDMVRLDIQYTNEWSLILDMKILVRTPMVVLMCEGAY